VSKLNIRDEMRAIDCRDREWYNKLSDEDRDKFNKGLWVLTRWVSSVDSRSPEIVAHYLQFTNEFVNKDFNVLKKHPELQHMLMQLVGIGTPQYHKWIKPVPRFKNNGVKTKLLEYLSNKYPFYNQEELELLAKKNSKEDIIYEAECDGLSSKEIKELFA